MRTQIYDDKYRNTVICVDSYEDEIICGRLYSPYYEAGIEFKGVMELLKELDSMLEDINYPQAYSSRRVFWSEDEKKEREFTAESVKVGRLATLSMRILFRQNSSWQGSLYWCEERRDESFRSVLELLLLIDSALCYALKNSAK